MSNRSRHTHRPVHRCASEAEHALERWCLEESIKLGNWASSGLIPEYIAGRLEGFWKRMRCGCTFVVLVVES